MLLILHNSKYSFIQGYPHISLHHGPLTRYVTLRVAHAPGMPGTFSLTADSKWKPLVSDPGMHHGTCVSHVPWCMSGLLAPDGGKTFPAFPAHAHLQFSISCKRPIAKLVKIVYGQKIWEMLNSIHTGNAKNDNFYFSNYLQIFVKTFCRTLWMIIYHFLCISLSFRSSQELILASISWFCLHSGWKKFWYSFQSTVKWSPYVEMIFFWQVQCFFGRTCCMATLPNMIVWRCMKKTRFLPYSINYNRYDHLWPSPTKIFTQTSSLQ